MKKIAFFLSIMFFMGTMLVHAQTRKVTGTVTSAEDNLPIPGVSVSVKGTTIGSTTNLDGAFEISVPQNTKTLLFSFIGMKNQEVEIGNQTTFNIKMETDVVGLDEVVITALGISREKKSLGFSTQEVQSGELTKAGQLNITQSLAGKVAGVQINQFGGSVGASSRITIRGNSSFAADQQPLIVVDGVPIANDTRRTGDNAYSGTDYGSGLNDINPEDIESITVLKGGSAALYGMRAGRGVILITTKSGKNTKGVTISYDGNVTLERVANLPKMQNLYGQGHNGDELHWKQYVPEDDEPEANYKEYSGYSTAHGFNFNGTNTGYDESWGPRMDIGLMIPQFDSPKDANGKYSATPWVSHPNNIRDFFQTGLAMNHTLSVLAQTDRATTRASISYRDQKGTVPNTDQKRYSGQLNTEMKLNDKVSFEMNANFTHTASDNLVGQGYADNSPLQSLTIWSGRQINMQSLKDNWDQKDEEGNYTHYNWIPVYHLNPYFTVNKNTNSMERTRLFGKVSLFYQPFKTLRFEARTGYDYYNMKVFERYFFHWNSPEGSFDQQNTSNANLEADLIGSYNENFGDFSLSAIAGANYRNQLYEYSRLGADQLVVPGVYTISNVLGTPTVGMDHSHIRSNSVYGSASIGWKNQLYLDASARNDWSSTLSQGFFYPSASLSWIATESFGALKNDVLSFLKFRFGVTQVGAAAGAYQDRAYYSAETTTYNGVPLIVKSTVIPNENLRPENMASWEGGIEFGLFNDRLHADMSYYQKVTTDQIMTVPTANSTGYSGMLINAGRIENKGIDLQLVGRILQNKDGLNWTTTVNFSRDRAKVVELAPEYENLLKVVQLGWTWGIPNQAIKGEEWGVLVSSGYDRVTQEDIDNGLVADGIPVGAIKVDESGLERSKAGVQIAHVSPDFLTSMRNDFSYKSFGFGFYLDARVGGEIWSQTMSHSFVTGVASVTAENGIRERMIVPGKDIRKDDVFVMQDDNGKWVPNTIEVTAQDWYETGGTNESYVFDGSFLKLREVYLSYTLPASFLAKTKTISKATVSLVGSNLALIAVDKSNVLRLDPEAGGVSSDTRGIGYEQGGIPIGRTFGFKLNLTF